MLSYRRERKERWRSEGEEMKLQDKERQGETVSSDG